MENILNGGVEELKVVRAAVARRDKLASEMEESEKLLAANDKEVAAQKKFMNDRIEATIRNRREELTKTHDERISSAQKDLRSAEKNRKTAKDNAVNARISGETEDLTLANKKLNSQINGIFHKAKLSRLCNTTFFYALFFARTAKDFLIFALTVLITIAVIPNIVCALVNFSTVAKILIYVGIVLFFIAIYFVIFILSKNSPEKTDAFDKALQIRKKIRANNKQIKLLSKNIRKDSDESSYGLGGYDEDIQHCEDILTEAEDAKVNALADFDAYTAQSIETEITNEAMPAIEQLEADGKALKADYTQKQEELLNHKTELANTYTAFLGSGNMTVDRIDELINILSSGQAQTIMQALDILNGNK